MKDKYQTIIGVILVIAFITATSFYIWGFNSNEPNTLYKITIPNEPANIYTDSYIIEDGVLKISNYYQGDILRFYTHHANELIIRDRYKIIEQKAKE